MECHVIRCKEDLRGERFPSGPPNTFIDFSSLIDEAVPGLD